MRKRYILSGAFALTLMTSSAVAFGDSLTNNDDPPSNKTSGNNNSSSSNTVILPSGDTVTLTDEGRVHFDAANDSGDTGFFSPSALDGSDDVMVIPSSRAGAIAAGEEDPALYNVSALLRAGYSDAREADASTLGDIAYGQFVPIGESSWSDDEDTVEVNVEVTDASGEAPEAATVQYVSLADGETGEIMIEEDGTGTTELPPGDYEFVSYTRGAPGEPTDVVGGIKGTTVDEDNADLTFDGTEAVLVESTVEGVDTDREYTSIDFGINNPEEDIDTGVVGEVQSGNDIRMLPVDAGEGNTERFFSYFPLHLEAASEPGEGPAYYLVFEELDGISEDLSYEVSPDELAEVNTRYGSLGSEENGVAGLCGSTERTFLQLCYSHEVEFPTERTDFVMPGEDFTWVDQASFGEDMSEEIIVQENLGSLEAGPMERELVGTPLSLTLQNGVIARIEDGLEVAFLPLDNGVADESILSEAVEGTVTLEQDGEVVDSVDDVAGVLAIPEGESGRYTLTVEAESATELTPLATQSQGTWEFDAEPTDEGFEFLDLSSIELLADGVVDGLAPADEPLNFTMNYAPQQQASESELDDISVEVSYDDGETWNDIPIDIDDNQVTGTMEHPEDAEFVSVRTMAEDEDGNRVTQETIKAFGLQ